MDLPDIRLPIGLELIGKTYLEGGMGGLQNGMAGVHGDMGGLSHDPVASFQWFTMVLTVAWEEFTLASELRWVTWAATKLIPSLHLHLRTTTMILLALGGSSCQILPPNHHRHHYYHRSTSRRALIFSWRRLGSKGLRQMESGLEEEVNDVWLKGLGGILICGP